MTMHQGLIDWSDPLGIAIVAVGAIGTAWTLVLAFWLTLRPGEHDPDHPKNVILREDR